MPLFDPEDYTFSLEPQPDDYIGENYAGEGGDRYDPTKQFQPELYESIAPSTQGEFMKGISRGVEHASSGFRDFGNVLDVITGGEGESAPEEVAASQARLQRNKARIGSLSEAETFGDYMDFLVGGTAESIPFLATTVASGGVAGLTAKAVGSAAVGVRAAQTAGAFASTSAVETGFTFGEIKEATGEKSPYKALVAGGLKGALDTYSLGRGISNILNKNIGKAGAVSLLKDISKTAAREGVTEAIQELIDIGAVRVEEGELIKGLSTEEQQRLLDAAVLGAAGGIAISAGGKATIKFIEKLAKPYDDGAAKKTVLENLDTLYDVLPEVEFNKLANTQGYMDIDEWRTAILEDDAYGTQDEGLVQEAYDSVEYNTLDDAAKAQIDTIGLGTGVPWPSVGMWVAAGSKKATDRSRSTMDELLADNEDAQVAYDMIIEDGGTEQEAQNAAEIASPYEFQSARDKVLDDANRSGANVTEEFKAVARSFIRFARRQNKRADGTQKQNPNKQWIALEQMVTKAAQEGTLPDLFADMQYIQKRETTDAAPFRDVGYTAEELVSGQNSVLEPVAFDEAQGEQVARKDQIIVDINGKNFSIDLFKLINSAMRQTQGPRAAKQTSNQRFNAALQTGLSSLLNTPGVNAEALAFEIEKVFGPSQETVNEMMDAFELSGDLEAGTAAIEKMQRDADNRAKKIITYRHKVFVNKEGKKTGKKYTLYDLIASTTPDAAANKYLRWLSNKDAELNKQQEIYHSDESTPSQVSAADKAAKKILRAHPRLDMELRTARENVVAAKMNQEAREALNEEFEYTNILSDIQEVNEAGELVSSSPEGNKPIDRGYKTSDTVSPDALLNLEQTDTAYEVSTQNSPAQNDLYLSDKADALVRLRNTVVSIDMKDEGSAEYLAKVNKRFSGDDKLVSKEEVLNNINKAVIYYEVQLSIYDDSGAGINMARYRSIERKIRSEQDRAFIDAAASAAPRKAIDALKLRGAQADKTITQAEKKAARVEAKKVREARKKIIREHIKNSQGYYPNEDVSLVDELDYDWANDTRMEYVAEQLQKMVDQLGLGNTQAITPDKLNKLTDYLPDAYDWAPLASGKLYGQVIPLAWVKAKFKAEYGTRNTKDMKAAFKRDTGIDLNGKTDFFVYVNPKRTRKEVLSALSHEVGHVLLYDAIKRNVPLDAINKEYAAYLEKIKKDPAAREVFKDNPDQAWLSLETTALNMKVSDYIDVPSRATHMNYLIEFDEWFADRVRNRLMSPLPPKGKVDKFFSGLADGFTGIFTQGKTAEGTVEAYVDAVMGRSKENPWAGSKDPHEVLAAWRDEIEVTRNSVLPKEENKEYQERTSDIIKTFLGRTLPRAYAEKQAIEMTKNLMSMQRDDALGAAFNKAFRIAYYQLLQDGDGGGANTERAILLRATNSPYVKRQIANLLRNNPEAWADAQSDPEAMMAYAYQFWITGHVDLSKRANTIFQKIFDALKEMLGLITDSENAEMLFDEFTTGNALLRLEGHSDASFAVKDATRDTRLQKIFNDVVVPKWEAMTKSAFGYSLFSAAAQRLHQTGNEHLIKLNSQVYAKIGTQFEGEDMLTARTKNMARFTTIIRNIYDGKDEEFGKEVAKMLNEGKIYTAAEQKGWKKLPEADQAVLKTRGVLREMHAYMTAAGVDVGFQENYFPWVFDETYVREHANELEQLLSAPEFAETLAKEGLTPEYIVRGIIQGRGLADGIEATTEDANTSYIPAANALKTRTLAFIEKKGTREQREQLGKFFSDNLGLTLNTYVEQVVKRTEFQKRFGGKQFEAILRSARDAGATNDEIKMARLYMNAVMGVHGQDTNRWLHKFLGLEAPPQGEIINPKLQRAFGIAMVYQNLRVLALATLTSLVDPIGIAVRTGDMGIAYNSFREGVRITYSLAKGNKETLHDLAEMLGVLDRHMTVEALNWEYGGVYITGTERRINEVFFQATGLQAWTKATRLMGTVGGLQFLAKHSQHPTEHSERFLAELNLRPEDVKVDAKGRTHILTSAERRAASKEEIARDDRVRSALHRFVDGSILRPNATLRPIWASDPHFMLIFHLKSFMYAFHERILKRIVLESANGNMAPLLLAGMFIPVMLASDEIRDLIQYGGDGNPQKAQWGMMDHIGNSLQRAGLLGLGQIAVDAGDSINYGGLGYESLIGPTGSQIDDILFSEDYKVSKALPFSTVGKHYWENL